MNPFCYGDKISNALSDVKVSQIAKFKYKSNTFTAIPSVLNSLFWTYFEILLLYLLSKIDQYKRMIILNVE